MTKRLGWLTLPVAGMLAGVVLAPAAAVAASASFTSGGSTPAVAATNTSTGLAVDAATGNGTAVRATGGGSNNGSAMFLRSTATGDGSNALYAKSYATSGKHFGVQGVTLSPSGVGVYGQGATDGTGVLGTAAGAGAGVVGAGGVGVVSDGELLTLLHVVDSSATTGTAGDVAGTFNQAGQATASVSFPHAFPAGLTPVVVVTPGGDPSTAGAYWVTRDVGTNGETTGFTLHTANAATLPWNYVVVGFADPAAAAASPAAQQMHQLGTRAGAAGR